MAARKSKWSYVKDNIDNGNITEWCQTMTERQIAEACGVSMAAFSIYKTKYPELVDTIKAGRASLCTTLKGKLIKKAMGYKTEKVKTYVKDDGGKKVKVVEKTEEEVAPDTGAIHLLLKNLDPEWRNDDKVTTDLKQKELEARKEAEKNKYLFKDK